MLAPPVPCVLGGDVMLVERSQLDGVADVPPPAAQRLRLRNGAAAAVPLWPRRVAPPNEFDDALAVGAEERAVALPRSGDRVLFEACPDAGWAVVEAAVRKNIRELRASCGGRMWRPAGQSAAWPMRPDAAADGFRKARCRAGVLRAAPRRAQAGSVDFRDRVAVAGRAEPVGSAWRPGLAGVIVGCDLAALVAATGNPHRWFGGGASPPPKPFYRYVGFWAQRSATPPKFWPQH